MKNSKAVVLIAVLVLTLAAVLIYFDKMLISSIRQTAQESQNTKTAPTDTKSAIKQSNEAVTNDSLKNTESKSSQAETGHMEGGILLKDEKVVVDGNTPEYELELRLCENTENRKFIKLQYYLNGVSIVKEISDAEIPELEGIFIIDQTLLNPVHSQLYMRIHGTALDVYTQTSLYMVRLNDMSVIKLFSYPGAYGEMAFNKDFSMLAYSFGDPPHLSFFQEDSLVEVYNCAKEEFIIKKNRDSTGNILGQNSSAEYLYDYEFEVWHSTNVLKLKQSARPKSNLNSAPVKTEVLYDVQENILLNADGSELKPLAAGGGTEASETRNAAGAEGAEGAEETGGASGQDKATGDKATGDKASEEETGGKTGSDMDGKNNLPEKVLESFYSFLSSEKDYSKAMQLLDDSFILKLGIIKQFGVESINKSDIDAEGVSLYSELLKAAKLDTIAEIKTKDDICTIVYSQIMELSQGSQVEQQMSAQLKKYEGDWKIILIEDGV